MLASRICARNNIQTWSNLFAQGHHQTHTSKWTRQQYMLEYIQINH